MGNQQGNEVYATGCIPCSVQEKNSVGYFTIPDSATTTARVIQLGSYYSLGSAAAFTLHSSMLTSMVGAAYSKALTSGNLNNLYGDGRISSEIMKTISQKGMDQSKPVTNGWVDVEDKVLDQNPYGTCSVHASYFATHMVVGKFKTEDWFDSPTSNKWSFHGVDDLSRKSMLEQIHLTLTNSLSNGVTIKAAMEALCKKRGRQAKFLNGFNDIIGALCDGKVVVVCLQLCKNFFYASNRSITRGPERAEEHDYHAVPLYGFFVEKGEVTYFAVQNSWGTRWGEKGQILIEKSYILNYGSDFCVMV